MRRIIIALFMVMGMCFMGIEEISAQEVKFELNAQFGIREVLTSQIGKRVSVRTDSGEALEGTVTKVGDHLLHISKLSGRDFYDAVVRIDRINSLVLKAR